MQLFANNADSSLDGAISADSAAITVKAGEGTKFPAPINGDYFMATLFQKVGTAELNYEIVKCTARAGDVLTVVRAQEGTTAKAFNDSDKFELRVTAAAFDNLVQNKVDKIAGKGLSTEDYSTAEKTKLSGVAEGATANAADAALRDRTTHTGAQAISTVTGLQGALDAKAPLASPALTGTPTAPTAAQGTNTTQLATTAHVYAAAIKAPAAWTSANINASTDATGTASAQIVNNGGSGDAGLAALAFHCSGVYGTKLHLRADGFFGLGGWSRVAWGWYLDNNNNMIVAGNVTAYSDPRLKENFQRVSKPFDILNKLDGGTFNWRHGFPHIASKAGKRDYGILADQVQAVMPEIITESIDIDDKKYLTVSYEKLVPVLIEAVRELNARVQELEAA